MILPKCQRNADLLLLLAYARAANVHLEVQVDDGLNLPGGLPSRTTHAGVRRKSPATGGANY
jgi:hypothetical protein